MADKKKPAFIRDAYVKLRMQAAFDQKHPAPDEIPTGRYALFDIALGGTGEGRPAVHFFRDQHQ